MRQRTRHLRSGQTVVIVALFFAAITMAILLVLAEPALRQLSQTASLKASGESYFTARSVAEDYLYRMTAKMNMPTGNLNVGGNIGSITIQNVGGETVIIASGYARGEVRKFRMGIVLGVGTAFHYGLQSGNGGIAFGNNPNAAVYGNVYSNGTLTGSGNLIDGTAISAGEGGLLDDVHVTGDAFARTMNNSVIDGDAHYVTKSGTTIGGTAYQIGLSDLQPTVPLPISDQMLDEWEDDAFAGGKYTGPCDITTDKTIGPNWVDCDPLTIKGATVTLLGPVWVKGSIQANTFTKIWVDPSVGPRSVAVIADKASEIHDINGFHTPINRLSSSKITLGQTGSFRGSGLGNSYVLLVSRNNSAENGGTENAIRVEQSIEGDLLVYANHGYISLGNTVTLREVTAYKILLDGSAQVIYDLGLANTLFSAGPGGQYEMSWFRETE